MIINILDRQFNFLGQMDEFESFMPAKKYYGIGSFELHTHEDARYAPELQKEKIIYTGEDRAYIILYRHISSITGKLVVKGIEVKGYLNRLLVFPPSDSAYFRINDNAETIIKTYVQATLSRKGIVDIEVAPDKKRGIKTVYQSRYKNLASEIEKIGKVCGLGWDIKMDINEGKFIFDVKEGLDRSMSQSENANAIFSIDYDNIAGQELLESRLDYANTAIVAGQGEGADREIEIVGDYNSGLDSYELFVDARDIKNSTDLPERGMQKLTEVEEIFSFDSEVLADRNLTYKEDFNLGDIATMQNSKWNITKNRRITEVTEVYEKNGFRLDVIFGEALPSLTNKIKQEMDEPIFEGDGGIKVVSGANEPDNLKPGDEWHREY